TADTEPMTRRRGRTRRDQLEIHAAVDVEQRRIERKLGAVLLDSNAVRKIRKVPASDSAPRPLGVGRGATRRTAPEPALQRDEVAGRGDDAAVAVDDLDAHPQ